MAELVKREPVSWWELFKRTFKEAIKQDVLGRSAQLAYYFFLALFPLLICIFAMLSLFAAHGEHLRQAMLNFLGRALPGSASKLVVETIEEVNRAHATSEISVGLVFSLWSASAGMSAIMDALNGEYRVVETRGFIRKKAVAIALTCVTGVLVVAAVALVVAGGSIADVFARSAIVVLLLKIVAWPIDVGLVLVAFALMYFFAPDVKDHKWHWVTPGAVAALVLWLVVSIGLKIYIQFFDRYNETYGSLGAVIVLLLWFYLTGLAILLGGEMNRVIEEEAAQAGAREAKMKGEKESNQAREVRHRGSAA